MNTLVMSVSDKENDENAMDIPVLCYFCGEPIVKMNGKGADAYCGHHTSYSPEVIVPAHIGCNVRYHNRGNVHRRLGTIKSAKRNKVLNSFSSKKELICYFCGGLITEREGISPESLIIHSLDGNHANWDPDNKVPVHWGCHSTHHRKNKKASLETLAKLMGNKNPNYRGKYSAKLWNRRRELYGPSGYKDPEAFGRIISKKMSGKNNPMYGRKGKDHPAYGRQVSDETRQKLSDSLTGRNCQKNTRRI